MKFSIKHILPVLILFSSVPAAFAQADSDIAVAPSTGRVVADKILMYIPNRIVDLTDIFTLSLGTGVTAKAKLRLTHAFGAGFGIGPSGMLIKGFDRQYGTALETDSEIFILAMGQGTQTREYSTGNVIDYWYNYHGMQFPDERIFQKDKIKDYWALEVEIAAFVDVRFAIHPVQIADFFVGLFTFDLGKDDYTLILD